MSNYLRLLLLLILTVSLTACFRSYKYDVQQGNIVDQDRLSKVEQGMSKRDVQSILGTPLVQDRFHPDRWDYAYFLKEGRSRKTDSRRVTIFFKDDKLTRVAGDVTPATTDAGDEGIKVIKIEGKANEEGIFGRTLDNLFKKEETEAP
jgi:outer membrane protein assembly factor BamE